MLPCFRLLNIRVGSACKVLAIGSVDILQNAARYELGGICGPFSSANRSRAGLRYVGVNSEAKQKITAVWD
jgi:hypothetical protein